MAEVLNDSLSQVQAIPSLGRRELARQWLGRARTWALRLAEYGLVQAAVQGVGAVAGILVIRNLSKNQYALFAITNSM